MLENIKLLLGLTTDEKDELIELLISQATAEAKEYTNNSNTKALSSAILQMVIYKYNRLGTESLSREEIGGIAYTYISDYPKPVLRLLKKYRKIVTL